MLPVSFLWRQSSVFYQFGNFCAYLHECADLINAISWWRSESPLFVLSQHQHQSVSPSKEFYQESCFTQLILLQDLQTMLGNLSRMKGLWYLALESSAPFRLWDPLLRWVLSPSASLREHVLSVHTSSCAKLVIDSRASKGCRMHCGSLYP